MTLTAVIARIVWEGAAIIKPRGQLVNPLHVRHVRETLEREYRPLIDLSDIAHRPDSEQRPAFLSRALAALAAQYLTGCDAARAAASVIDGYDDGGYDVVMVNDVPPHLWLVQSKWSDAGTASLSLGDPGKMRTGLDQMLNGEFEKFNGRFQAMAGEVDAIISDPNVRITIVIAQMGASALTSRVKDAFDRLLRDLNGNDQMVNLEVLGLTEFHKMVRAGVAAPRIDLDVSLESPAMITMPYRVYHGALPAEVVADWYQQYGHRMFDQNLRKALGVTSINKGMIDTLLEAPESFLYFNNGITLLCESIDRSARQRMRPDAPADLRLTGVSVVNGAQTVACIHEAIRLDGSIAARARVWARIISLESCPEGFGADVTRATNTQNQISRRDYVALDDTQTRLKYDFRLSLQKDYVIKRGEEDPEPSEGCSVADAAVALACAHPSPEFAVRARNDADVLYERGLQGAYSALFPEDVQAHRVWRAVQLLRRVRETLSAVGLEVVGRAGQIAKQGDLLIAHIVAQRIGQRELNNLDTDWDDACLPQVEPMSRTVLMHLIARADELYPRAPVQSLFMNRERCGQFAKDIRSRLDRGVREPDLAPSYRATKAEGKFNAVAVIVDGSMLPEGTVLEFRPGSGPQRRQFSPWLSKDPRRGRATWVNDRARPLIWEADRAQYSPDGLVRHMTALITGKPSSAGQGIRRWYVPGQGCLADIASASPALDEGAV